jgi:hypothetical protein
MAPKRRPAAAAAAAGAAVDQSQRDRPFVQKTLTIIEGRLFVGSDAARADVKSEEAANGKFQSDLDVIERQRASVLFSQRLHKAYGLRYDQETWSGWVRRYESDARHRWIRAAQCQIRQPVDKEVSDATHRLADYLLAYDETGRAGSWRDGDLAIADSCIPIFQLHSPCLGCGRVPHYVSLMTMWIRCGTCGIGDTWRHEFAIHLLSMTGFAARFNEPIDCSGVTAFDVALDRAEDHLDGCAPLPLIFVSRALSLLALLPVSVGLEIKHSFLAHEPQYTRDDEYATGWSPIEWNITAVMLRGLMADFASATDDRSFRDANILFYLNKHLKRCGASALLPFGRVVPVLTPQQLVLAFLGADD